jgi:hypothetical protein
MDRRAWRTKADPGEGEHLLYSFLTLEANGMVGPIHPKAMPPEEALKLQRPPPDEMLQIVAEGAKSDKPAEAVAVG